MSYSMTFRNSAKYYFICVDVSHSGVTSQQATEEKAI